MPAESRVTSRKPTIFLSRLIPEPGPSSLSETFDLTGNLEDRRLTRDELLEGVRGVDAILCMPTERIDEQVLDAAGPRLRVVSNFAVGYDNIDVREAGRRGVFVTNTPGVLTEATADIAWALILAVARKVVPGDRFVRAGCFEGWEPMLLLGTDLAGKTLGVVGMGRIGTAVARRSQGFGMKVIYTDAGGPLDPEQVPAGANWRHVSALDALLGASDVVTLHVPLTPETRGLIGPREIELMRPGAILINTARGPVVDEAALVEALRSGRLRGAGFDVYHDEPALAPGLADLDNVVLLPHLGSATEETRRRMAQMAAENAAAVFRGHRPRQLVNADFLPEGRDDA